MYTNFNVGDSKLGKRMTQVAVGWFLPSILKRIDDHKEHFDQVRRDEKKRKEEERKKRAEEKEGDEEKPAMPAFMMGMLAGR